MQEHLLFLRLNKGLTFLQSAFSIWITKRFSLVRECNVFLQCCSSSVFKKMVIYKIEMQLKPKVHQLWRIALCFGNYKLQLSVFVKTVWVFWPERVVPPWVIAFEQQSLECFVISKRVLRADRKADVNQTFQQSVFSPIRTCIRIWCTAGAVERRCQRLVHRPFRFSLSLIPRSIKGLFTGYGYAPG